MELHGHAPFSGAQAESLGEERAAMAQAFLVDAVADALGQVPLDRHLERGQCLRALEQRLRGMRSSSEPCTSRTGGFPLISPAMASGLTLSGSTKMPE
jgi:hypothetical protein